ncbi:hypothetical protein BT93_L0223 [Corymbia citriodora subsp. variegata]|uniref:GATA-type domain-containing protein n=1 Tax=Corymbia citriodora subsp. variegata TaxID=360336 RepID=A0A8T0CFP7_CORYI|nr:hypothetical protein BT93_L0223 [Corymbia citriodora subsp. variegata]
MKTPYSTNNNDSILTQSIPPPPLSTRHSATIHRSPRLRATSLDQPFAFTGSTLKSDVQVPPLPFVPEQRRQSYQFVEHAPQPLTASQTGYQFEPRPKLDEHRSSFKASGPVPYSDTVKQHLDIYEAEVAMNEASSRAHDISKTWMHRYHQMPHSEEFAEGLPDPLEVDEVIRSTQHIIGLLTRLRDTSCLQQNLIQEHHRRDTRRIEDVYGEDQIYESAEKKRRGKAAPPGRCHSCNRAETPEWRRGPDGARTLCNACGLHYAKLTRKVGASKAASLTGSSLRPKSLHEARN